VTATLQELQDALEDPRKIVAQVLPAVAWEAGHIPGSISLPLAEIPARAATVLPDKNQPIIVYCGGPT
jgi:rhodanese-related sulfurtransferase